MTTEKNVDLRKALGKRMRGSTARRKSRQKRILRLGILGGPQKNRRACRQLSVKDRNVFQQIYDYIVRAIKNATGDAELRQLNAIKENFDKAYREIGGLESSTETAKYAKTKRVDLSKQEYAILRKEIVRQNANLKNSNENTINGAFTENHYHVYETWGDDSFDIVKTIPIEGNEDLIKTLQRRIRKGLDEDETVSTSELVDSITENLRARRRSNDGSNANVARRRTDRETGIVDRQEPTSKSNRDYSTSRGDKPGLNDEPPKGGSFNGDVKYSRSKNPPTAKRKDVSRFADARPEITSRSPPISATMEASEDRTGRKETKLCPIEY